MTARGKKSQCESSDVECSRGNSVRKRKSAELRLAVAAAAKTNCSRVRKKRRRRRRQATLDTLCASPVSISRESEESRLLCPLKSAPPVRRYPILPQREVVDPTRRDVLRGGSSKFQPEQLQSAVDSRQTESLRLKADHVTSPKSECEPCSHFKEGTAEDLATQNGSGIVLKDASLRRKKKPHLLRSNRLGQLRQRSSFGLRLTPWSIFARRPRPRQKFKVRNAA